MKKIIGCGVLVGLMSLPSFGGGIEVVGSHGAGSDIWMTNSVFWYDGRVFTSWLNAGIDVFDVDDRFSPELVTTSMVNVQGPFSLTWEANVYHDMVFVSVDGFSFQGLWIADVSDPSNPVGLGTFDIGGNRDMVLMNDDVLFSRYSETVPMSTGNSLGFRAIDVSDPSSPGLIVEVESPGTMNGLAISEIDSLVFIADGEMGLGVYDVSDPANPVAVGSWSDPDFYAQDVAATENSNFPGQARVYVTGGGQLRVFRVPGSGMPELFGTFDYPDPAQITEVFGNEIAVVRFPRPMAYVMNGREELLVVDVSSPSSMELVNTVEIEGGLVTDIAAREQTVYLSDEVQGLLVVGVSACQADLNGDGRLNFFDVSEFLALFSAGSSCADFIGNPDGSPDGNLNAFDVSGFLSMFGAGCP